MNLPLLTYPQVKRAEKTIMREYSKKEILELWKEVNPFFVYLHRKRLPTLSHKKLAKEFVFDMNTDELITDLTLILNEARGVYPYPPPGSP